MNKCAFNFFTLTENLVFEKRHPNQMHMFVRAPRVSSSLTIIYGWFNFKHLFCLKRTQMRTEICVYGSKHCAHFNRRKIIKI